MLDALEASLPASSSGRTSPEFSVHQTTHLVVSWVHSLGKMASLSHQGKDGRTLVLCLDQKEQSRGASLTPNISEWPNDAVVCSLSQVLEAGSIPQQYFLSSTACAGILRRAEKRGKALPPTLRQALEAVAHTHSKCEEDATGGGKGYLGSDEVAFTLSTLQDQTIAQPIGFNTRQDPDSWQDRTEPVDTHYGTQGVVQPIATDLYNGAIDGDATHSLRVGNGNAMGGVPSVMQTIAPSLTASNDPSRSPQSSEVTQQVGAFYQAAMQVRRLTPTECERLQGFPDGYTNIPWRGKPESPDGPRYKALGNSMAVPCMAWIGNRINQHDALH